MSNVFTLDSLREETKKKFAPFKIRLTDGSEVSLSSMLRIPAEDRKAVRKALDEVSDLSEADDTPESIESMIEAISKILNVIADKPAKLLSELDDEDPQVKVMLMSKVVLAWAKETQLGEASNSPS